jgi:hypothetical protein
MRLPAKRGHWAWQWLSWGDTVLLLGGEQLALVWTAVLTAGVKSVKLGSDLELAVADVVPTLILKENG